MASFIHGALAAIALSLFAHGAPAKVADPPASNAGESFHVSLRVGEPMSRDFGIVLGPARHGEIEVAGGRSHDGGMRVGVTLVDVEGVSNSPFRRKATLQVSVHEEIGGAWVLRGESLLHALEGVPVQETFSSSLGDLELSVTFNGESRSSPLGRGPARLLPGMVGSLRAVCCTSACRDGSGQTLRCCASGFSCSGCGTSCSGEDP